MYETKSGDTWDWISKLVYGSEMHIGWLIQHNPAYADVFLFDSGVILETPPLPKAQSALNAPIWRECVT